MTKQPAQRDQGAHMAQLDAALHDAYEAMGPSADAEARILSALREEATHEATHVQTAPVTGPAGHRRWLVILPLAACLALAAIGLSMRAPVSESASGQFASRETTSQETAANDASPIASTKADQDETEAVSEEAAATTDVSPAYALVTLPTGDVLEVGEPYDGAVDTTNAMEATATTADGTSATACEVVDTRWVRFEGDPTWYTCTPQAHH